MAIRLLDLLRARHPHNLPLTSLPPDFLTNRFQSAQELESAIRVGQIEVTCAAPDHGIPVTLEEWMVAFEDVAKGSNAWNHVSLQLPIRLERKKDPRMRDFKEDYAYPDEVKRSGDAYQQICHSERLLRDRVHQALLAGVGEYESNPNIIPIPVRTEALKAMQAEKEMLGDQLSSRLIDYVDFGFVIELVAKHWNLVSKEFLMERADWEQTKRELVQLRNAVMHSRRLKRHQSDILSAAYVKVLRALGMSPYANTDELLA